MSRKLYKYQEDMVNRAGKNTALFWDMGLGKTVTSLNIFKKFYNNQEVKNLFVICPISMIDEWVQEFQNELELNAIKYKDLIKKASKEIGDGHSDVSEYLKTNNIHCVVLNYDMVWRIKDYQWLNSDWCIICDESHRIKNPNSKVGKYMKFLKFKTEYKICLTGTPQSIGYVDYYNQLYFLGKINMSFPEFKGRYCLYEDKVFNSNYGNNYGGNGKAIKIKQLVGYKNVQELEDLYIKKCEFLKVNRVYDEIIKYNMIELPTDKKYERVLNDKVIYLDSNNEIVTSRNEINKFLSNDKSSIVENFKLLDNPGAFRMGLRQLLNNEYKQKWLSDFLEDYDQRIVIFYNFNSELETLKRVCESQNRLYSIYNGGEKNFDNFKKYENGVIFCNYQSGSVGINDLVISNIFIAYSPCENYINWEQSKKRIDRNGQEHTPIYYFLCSGLEKRIYYSLSIGKNFDDRVFLEEINK